MDLSFSPVSVETFSFQALITVPVTFLEGPNVTFVMEPSALAGRTIPSAHLRSTAEFVAQSADRWHRGADEDARINANPPLVSTETSCKEASRSSAAVSTNHAKRSLEGTR